jgi:hypothetical protein
MPRKLITVEEITSAWEKKRERDKKAQATWVSNHHTEHLARMKIQYQKKKEKKKQQTEPTTEVEPKIEVNSTSIFDRIRDYKQSNPSATQKDISVALSTSQSSVSRALKK